jgi:hypothetical protein
MVAPGDRVPVDGLVEQGRSDLDLSMLTGETAPFATAPGALIAAGALNLTGNLIIRAQARSEDSTVAAIARLMEVGAQSKSAYVRLADKAAALYVPVVHSLAALTLAGWWMAGAPMVLPDLARVAPFLAGVAMSTLVLALADGPRWAGPVAASVLFAGLHVAPLAGPYRFLAGVMLAAAAMAALVRPVRGNMAHPVLTALPLAGALAALAAIPVMARGAASDFAVAAAPLAALLLGAPAGTRLAGRRWGGPIGAGLAGGLAACVAFLLR